MTQYIKDNQLVEAIQWVSSNIEKAIEWLGNNLISEQREGIGAVGYWVKTVTGNVMISYGDYIIKSKGIFSICAKKEFETDYKLVSPWCAPIPKTEYIVCAAIWYKEQPTAKISVSNIDRGLVVCGHRHTQCIHTFVALTGKRSVTTECGEYEQGFLTSNNRFVDREEAAKIAVSTGQVKEGITYLFSEDIY